MTETQTIPERQWYSRDQWNGRVREPFIKESEVDGIEYGTLHGFDAAVVRSESHRLLLFVAINQEEGRTVEILELQYEGDLSAISKNRYDRLIGLSDKSLLVTAYGIRNRKTGHMLSDFSTDKEDLVVDVESAERHMLSEQLDGTDTRINWIRNRLAAN